MPLHDVRRPRARAVLALVLALPLAFCLPAVAASQITPEQVTRLDAVASVAMSPDGRWVAYTVSHPRPLEDTTTGRPQSGLWIVAAAGGDPRPIVQRPQTAGGPDWSPDGSTLAFLTRLADQHQQAPVYGVPAAGGTPRRLTDSPTGVMAFAFSPDGRRIAYTSMSAEDPQVVARRARGYDMQVFGEDQPRRHIRLWVENVGGGDRRAVTPDTLSVRDFAWSPDGATFALQVTRETDIDADYMFRRLMTVPVAGGALSTLASTEGKLGPMAWSPDGQRLAWLGAVALNDPLAQSVFVVGRGGGTPVNLTPGFEGSAVWVGWQDPQTVLFVAAQGTKTALNRVRAAGGAIERVLGRGAEIFQSASFDRARATFAVPANAAQHPSEVYVGTLRQPALRRVTRHNPFLQNVRLARQETITWTNRHGSRIEGVLTRPFEERTGTRYPLLVLPHGGPEGISFDGWTTRALYPAQVLAARGYAVLEPNYRGSGGRGVAFAQADHRDLGGGEFEDVIDGIDHLAAEGLIDPSRVGIGGTSYGGYFSAWATARHPERFRAGITFAGIANWISFTGQTDIPHEMSLVHWDLYWWESPGLTWDRSPLAWVNERTPPTMVVHGLADERVHPAQSLELYNTLRLRGVPAQMVLYPREPHGLLERAHQLDFMERMVGWFDRYVKPEARVVP